MVLKRSLRGRIFSTIGNSGFLTLIFVLVVGFITYQQYIKEGNVTATVLSVTTQQHVSGGGDSGVSTSYVYLIGTDKGVYEITPDGIFSSTAFGTLKEGKTYRFRTRGYSFPLIGMYPYIITAKEK